MRKKVQMGAAALLSLATVLHVSPAAARRFTALAGNPPEPKMAVCMSWDLGSNNTAGITVFDAATCKSLGTPSWAIPLQFDIEGGTKSVWLTGKQTAANQLTCGAVEYNASGTVVTSAHYPSFATNGYSTRLVQITPAVGDTVTVYCVFNADDPAVSDARILSVKVDESSL